MAYLAKQIKSGLNKDSKIVFYVYFRMENLPCICANQASVEVNKLKANNCIYYGFIIFFVKGYPLFPSSHLRSARWGNCKTFSISVL